VGITSTVLIDGYRGLAQALRLASRAVGVVVLRLHNSLISPGHLLLAHEGVALLQKRPVHKLPPHTRPSRSQVLSMRMTTRFAHPKIYA
jgi:hypothetical protein